MKVSDYLVSSSVDQVKALSLSRVIDIYKGVYLEYSDDFKKPVSQNIATVDEIIKSFEFLSAYIDNPKILNTVIKLCDLLEERGGGYLESEKYKDILNSVNHRVS
jgi:hypothetical protein